MVEGIFRVIGWIFMSVVLGILRLLGLIIGTAWGAAKDKRMLANARSGGAITPIPPIFGIPERFEHTHIVAGSGHGKTQLLQKMIIEDIGELKRGNGTIVVIDSQGDMIKNHEAVREIIAAFEQGERQAGRARPGPQEELVADLIAALEAGRRTPDFVFTVIGIQHHEQWKATLLGWVVSRGWWKLDEAA